MSRPGAPAQTVEQALALALWGTRMGTLSAAVAAGVAYASLVAMQFRGFRQFGVIGGLGMVLAWLTTFVLMPPLIAWLDRVAGASPPRPAPRARRDGAASPTFVSARPAVGRGRRAAADAGGGPRRSGGSAATSSSTTSRTCAGATPGASAKATGAGRWTPCSIAT